MTECKIFDISFVLVSLAILHQILSFFSSPSLSFSRSHTHIQSINQSIYLSRFLSLSISLNVSALSISCSHFEEQHLLISRLGTQLQILYKVDTKNCNSDGLSTELLIVAIVVPVVVVLVVVVVLIAVFVKPVRRKVFPFRREMT